MDLASPRAYERVCEVMADDEQQKEKIRREEMEERIRREEMEERMRREEMHAQY